MEGWFSSDLVDVVELLVAGAGVSDWTWMRLQYL